jgi:hypothetical protein
VKAAVAAEEKQLMGHLVAQQSIQPLVAKAWLREAMSPFDVVATLSAALAPAWTVEREIDPSGDLTIIVLPTSDASIRSAYVLYEDNGCAHVGTIRGEVWQSKRAFPTCQRAVAAIVAEATLST